MSAEAIAAVPPPPSALLRLARTFNANKTSWVGLGLFLLVVLGAVLAPVLSTHDPLDQNILARRQGPSAEFLLGTDSYGRDILARVLYGARVSLAIGLASTLVALAIGSVVGVLAGYVGGRLDLLVMQATDVLMSFPTLILGLIVAAMLGPEIHNLIVAIALTAIAPFIRIARAPTLAIKQRDFIEASRAVGASDLRIMVRHILPNIAAEILVMASLWLATAIRVEASLSFIGLGVKPPTPSWGGMVREGFEAILDHAWLSICPSLAILITIFALNLLGDGLRDAVDPKLRASG